ncbi:DUF6531 domain-containing protein [Chitinimonas sp. PSY-7]|uniref:DUF6531 domain-containing protein n=1 Tax=Chitinimonas sp. PSY-7 TaxID=3459088 RepID=UPI00403FDB35
MPRNKYKHKGMPPILFALLMATSLTTSADSSYYSEATWLYNGEGYPEKTFAGAKEGTMRFNRGYGPGCVKDDWIFLGRDYSQAGWKWNHPGFPTCDMNADRYIQARCTMKYINTTSDDAWCTPCPPDHYLVTGTSNAPRCQPLSKDEKQPGEEDEANRGDSCNNKSGNPINTATGNKFQRELDFPTGNRIPFTRTYNSSAGTLDYGLGKGWNHNWQARVLPLYVTVIAKPGDVDPSFPWPGENNNPPIVSYYRLERPDGSAVRVNREGVLSDPINRRNLKFELYKSGFKITTPSATEQYNDKGYLTSIAYVGWRTYNLTYQNGLLSQVSEVGSSYTLIFSYDANKHLTKVETNSKNSVSYGYTTSGLLTSATFADGKQRKYVYDDAKAPGLLAGIIDESQKRFATWAYDESGRAVRSEHANGTEVVTLTFGGDATAKWTDEVSASGAARRYQFIKQGKNWYNAGNSQPGGAGCNASNSQLKYDDLGNVTEKTDFNGIVTRYSYQQHGHKEISRTEAADKPKQRVVTTNWHSRFHLPTSIREPDQVTDYTYDAKGNLTAKTLYNMANGNTRSWSWTYDDLNRLTSAKDPASRVTTYTYDAKSNLATVTGPNGKTTLYTQYNTDGLPLSITSPNGVVTTLAYDPRGRLISQTVGTLTTAYSYAPTGLLSTVATPDGNQLTYSYDDAHRLTGVRDKLGNSIRYVLDAAGNRTREEIQEGSSNLSALTKRIDADLLAFTQPVPQAS